MKKLILFLLILMSFNKITISQANPLIGEIYFYLEVTKDTIEGEEYETKYMSALYFTDSFLYTFDFCEYEMKCLCLDIDKKYPTLTIDMFMNTFRPNDSIWLKNRDVKRYKYILVEKDNGIYIKTSLSELNENLKSDSLPYSYFLYETEIFYIKTHSFYLTNDNKISTINAPENKFYRIEKYENYKVVKNNDRKLRRKRKKTKPNKGYK